MAGSRGRLAWRTACMPPITLVEITVDTPFRVDQDCLITRRDYKRRLGQSGDKESLDLRGHKPGFDRLLNNKFFPPQGKDINRVNRLKLWLRFESRSRLRTLFVAGVGETLLLRVWSTFEQPPRSDWRPGPDI
jgi:hypothetical protein